MLGLLARVGLLALGLLLAVVTLEAVMQIAAAFHRGWNAPVLMEPTGPDAHRVLALGDSNTYGVLVPHDRAYPESLQRVWNEQPGVPHIQVFNLGYPGNNSSGLLRNLRRMVATFHPDMVLIMIGANDYWTVPDEPSVGQSPSRSSRFDPRRWSRVYWLWFMVRRAWQTPTLDMEIPAPSVSTHGEGKARYGDAEFDLSWTVQPGGVKDWVDRLKTNLATMASQVRMAGVMPVFVTYPSELQIYGPVSDIIREIAQSTGTRLADVGSAFRTSCPNKTCPDVLFEDGHPKAAGYQIVAGILRDDLRDVLGAPLPSSSR